MTDSNIEITNSACARKTNKGLLAVVTAAITCMPVLASAEHGIHEVQISDITVHRTAGSYDTEFHVGMTAAGAAVAVAGLAGVTVASGGTLSAVSGSAAIKVAKVGATAGGGLARLLESQDSNAPDDLQVKLTPNGDATLTRYIQHSSGHETPREMAVGNDGGVESFNAHAKIFAVGLTGEHPIPIASVHLWEYDSGSANDDLGKLDIYSVADMKGALNAPEIVHTDSNGNEYYEVRDRLVLAPDLEDGSIYTVSYKVTQNVGKKSDIAPKGVNGMSREVFYITGKEHDLLK